MNFDKIELHNFIKEKSGAKIINEETILFDDLQIDGLDIYELMNEMAEKYDLDFSNLNLKEYCLDEYELGNFFLTIYRILFNRKALKKKSFPITHLYAVIEKGKWFEP